MKKKLIILIILCGGVLFLVLNQENISSLNEDKEANLLITEDRGVSLSTADGYKNSGLPEWIEGQF